MFYKNGNALFSAATKEEREIMNEQQTTDKEKKTSPAGHRARIFKKAKNEQLCDSELLELLLFYAVPRRDTRDVAHDLLSRFGSLRAVLQAGPTALAETKGVGENVIAFFSALNELCNRCREDFAPTPLMTKPKYDEFWKYLDGIYATVDYEVVDAYFLDSESRIYSSCRLAKGDECSVQFHPPTLSKILVETPPAGLVLVHNHPQSAAKPSDADKEMTEKCQILCSLHNVMFCDHVIYAKGHRFSYYDSGNLQRISKHYSIDNIVGGGNTHGGK